MSRQRRLPVYLLLDCSESMAGPAVEAVVRGVEALVSELRGDPQALETAHLSVITFDREARQVVPLTDLFQFEPPKLKVRPGTALGAALRLLRQCIEREVVRASATTKGDFKPLVFLLTDGQPTDDWEAAAEALRRESPRPANVYAIGCGPDVDNAVLRAVTDIVLHLDDLSPDALGRFFVWMSASVRSASLRPEPVGDSLGLTPLPSNVLSRAAEGEVVDPTPRQVFLNARCSRSRRPYLMRFARRDYDGRYEAIAAHPLDEAEDGEDNALPPVPSDMLDGCPPCPYCANAVAGLCPCGTLFCTDPTDAGPVVCPGCRARLSRGIGGPAEIRRSLG